MAVPVGPVGLAKATQGERNSEEMEVDWWSRNVKMKKDMGTFHRAWLNGYSEAPIITRGEALRIGTALREAARRSSMVIEVYGGGRDGGRCESRKTS